MILVRVNFIELNYKAAYEWIRKIILRVRKDGTAQLRVFGYPHADFDAYVKTEHFEKKFKFTPKFFSPIRGHCCELDVEECLSLQIPQRDR